MYPGVAARGALHASTGNVPGGIMGIAEERGLMKRFRRELALGVSLIALAAVLYLVHYVLFRNAHHIFIYLVGDLAFLPIEVLLVTIIIHRLLTLREKRVMLKKLNMVIGAFFSEVGTRLLVRLACYLPDIDGLRAEIHPTGQWSAKEFDALARLVASREIRLEAGRGTLEELKEFLSERQDFILRLLENSTLLEHDSFADLLWAVLHVSEELAARQRLDGLPATDIAHLSGDLTRAYGHLLREWVAHLRHLKEDYPYLFSLAVRTNPFDPGASALVS